MIRILLNGTAYPENFLSWAETNDVISRSDTFHGVIITQTLDIQLIKDAYDYIDGLDNTYDVAAECTFVRQSHDNINGWTDEFSGYLDFTTLKRDNQGSTKKLTISAYSSGFSNNILERSNIEIPYDRLETLDGGTITPFTDEYFEVDIEGIEVVGTDVPSIINENSYYDSTGDSRNVIFGIETEANNTSLKTVAAREYGGSELPTLINIGDVYYLAPTNATLSINYTINYDFSSDLATQPNNWVLDIYIYKIVFDDNYNYVSKTTLASESKTDKALDQTFSGTLDIELVKNEGIVFYCYHWAQNILTNQDSYIDIKADSTILTTYTELAPSTPCNFVPPLEMGTRIIESITGQSNGLDAPILGRTDSPTTYDEDGTGALYFNTNGRLIRQFPIGYQTTDEEKKSQLTASLESWFNNMDKVLCLGAGVKYEDDQYKLYVDDRKEFYLNEVVYTVSLSDMEVDSFEKEKDLSLYYNQINVGSVYEQPEEVSGLEEYNSPQHYSSPVPNDNTLDLLSQWIYAVYPVEFARRKIYSSIKSEDYKYDSNNFIFCVERDGADYIQFQDTDFDEINGLENISTYMNLPITPKRVLMRFEWLINAGYRGYQSDYLKYNASETVTDLSTRKIDEYTALVENEDILISDLESPKMTGEIVRFNAPVTSFSTLQDNPYGLIAYPDVLTGQTGYGYIKEISTNKIDKKTNFELWATTGFSEEGSFRLLQDGSYRLLEDGEKRLLED